MAPPTRTPHLTPPTGAPTGAPTSCRPLPPSHRDQGVALVIVLAFIVLLTGLIVAYFSRSMADRQLSNSSFNQTKADELARSALDIVTGDLKQELVNSGSATTGGNVTIYTDTEATPVRNGVPAKVSGTFPLPTLLRTSTTSGTTGLVDHLASPNAISTDTSANGRSISMARWNQHYLIPRASSTTSPTDTTPDPAFIAPSWVYVTKEEGPAVLSSPTKDAGNNTVTTTGRYAYAIYDEGALLDVNVAGYPSDLPYVSGSTMPSQYAGKGALAFADLTQLTGTSGNPLLTGVGINNLIGWRNYASMQAQGTFPSLTFSVSGPTLWNNYKNLILSNTNGFVKTSGSATASGQTDQAFLSRQQLIALCLASGTANFNPQALQYLGTFSRALNAPSWTPPADSQNLPGYQSGMGAPIAYKVNAELPSSVNRDIPNVRFPNAGIVTHYNDDGTTATYAVNAGDPLVQRRFSLAKLAWLRYDGPNPAAFNSSLSAQQQKDAIQACFGLKWQASTLPAPFSNARWEYVGPTGSTTRTSIETLDQIAQESPAREPNFFETLKAGILSGSLGRDPGPGINQNIWGVLSNFVNGTSSYKASQDLQVLQIGANIIDQFDTDSYPTAIHLEYYPLSSLPIDEIAINTVYGQENLPYMTGLFAIAIADPVPPSAGVSGTLKWWLQPQIWNPYQVPTSTPVNYPSEFCAYAYGRILGAWSTWAHSLPLNKGPLTYYDDGTGNGADKGLGTIYFTDPGDKTSPFYNNPQPLTLNMTTSTGALVVLTGPGNTPDSNIWHPIGPNGTDWSNLYDDVHGSGVNKFAGFAVQPDPNYNPDPNTDTVSYKPILPDSSLAYFSLQYKGMDGSYHPYNFMARLTQQTNQLAKYIKGGAELDPSPPVSPTPTVQGQTSITGWGPQRSDPRTDRLSEQTQWWDKNGMMSSTLNPNSIQGYGFPWAPQAGFPYLPGAFSYGPPYNPPTLSSEFIALWDRNDPTFSAVTLLSPTTKAYYADPDGIVRYGDSYRKIGDAGTSAPGDGGEMYNGSGIYTVPGGTTTAPGASSVQARRPVILNRPFRSVGELGYAYRDLPYKTLDFWSPTSGDAALLDLFSVADEPPVTAGQVNLNNAPPLVLQAILSGCSKNNSDPNTIVYAGASATTLLQISGASASMLASGTSGGFPGIPADIANNGPYTNRADLATRLGPLVSGTSGTPSNKVIFNTSSVANANWANKANAEAPMRALVDVTNTRTWNLMIDVIAQVGTFSPNAPPNAAALNGSFNVQGERRYWLHVAIDRFTGKIIDQQLEPVYE